MKKKQAEGLMSSGVQSLMSCSNSADRAAGADSNYYDDDNDEDPRPAINSRTTRNISYQKLLGGLVQQQKLQVIKLLKYK
jgi:hypothetical protein